MNEILSFVDTMKHVLPELRENVCRLYRLPQRDDDKRLHRHLRITRDNLPPEDRTCLSSELCDDE